MATLAASDLDKIGGRRVVVLSILLSRMASFIPNKSGIMPASSVRAPRRSMVWLMPLDLRAFSALRGPAKAASPPMAAAASSDTPGDKPIEDLMTTWRRVELEDAASISARSLLEISLLSAAGTDIEHTSSSPLPFVSSFDQTISLCDASHRMAPSAPSNAARSISLPLSSSMSSTIIISSQSSLTGEASPPIRVIPPRSQATEAASASDRTTALILGNSSAGTPAI
mmetsp:Transcript_17855/g.41692  ORF Transcript_17855/g.41692 Transcript_17855/m.41692 type:complete len:227 (-) Transcript_17855:380-1060(-)